LRGLAQLPAVLFLLGAPLLSGQQGRQESGEKAPDVRHDTVVVTGAYETIPLEEADRSVTLFELTGEAALLSHTLADFLKLDPSIDLRQRGPNSIQGDLSIRGSTFGQTLVLVDGMRVNDAQTGHHNLDLPFPVESLERVEVLKGSGSAFYGSDAMGGVVNLITRSPEHSEVRLRIGAGNYGQNQQRGSVALSQKRWSEHLTFSRDFSSGFIEDRDYRNLSLASRTEVATPLGPTTVVLALSDRPFGAGQFYGDFNSWERTKSWFASARQSLGERTQASFAFRRHTDLFVLYRDRPEDFTNRHAVLSYQGALRRWEPLGRNVKLHYGVEGFREEIDSNNLGSHDRARGAGYFALDVRALGRFSFTIGGRQEVYGSVNGQFSPTAAAGVWLSPHLKLRGSLSRAFRLPAFTDLYYHDPANRGSPNLRPESAWSYEAGLDWNTGGRFRGQVTVFQRKERDGIDYVRFSPDGVWRATNFQRLSFTGIEASLTVVPARKHRVQIGYTGLHGGQQMVAGVVSRYVFNYPRHTGLLTWEAALPAGMLARSRLGVVQRYGRDAYAVWDVYLAYNRGRIHPFLQLTNLTGASYEEIPGVVMPGRGILGGIEFVAYSAGR